MKKTRQSKKTGGGETTTGTGTILPAEPFHMYIPVHVHSQQTQQTKLRKCQRALFSSFGSCFCF